MMRNKIRQARAYFSDIEEMARIKGLNEGREEEARETAIRLLEMGLKIEQIAQATGLSLEEILALRHGEQGARL